MAIAPPLILRVADEADAPAIGKLIEHSVRVLQAGDYSPMQLEGGLGTVFGVDTHLIADRTYFVVDDLSRPERPIVACGGWSKRCTLFGSDHARQRSDDLLDPSVEAARIRAFSIHPDRARLGFGTELLGLCEAAATKAGFSHFELGATLTGERLFAARGYRACDKILVPLPNGATLPIIRMTKSFSPSAMV